MCVLVLHNLQRCLRDSLDYIEKERVISAWNQSNVQLGTVSHNKTSKLTNQGSGTQVTLVLCRVNMTDFLRLKYLKLLSTAVHCLVSVLVLLAVSLKG